MNDMQELRVAISREIRTVGLIEGPSDRLPPPRDIEAERAILSCMREHPLGGVNPRWFGYDLHSALCVAILACREIDVEPTTERLVVAVESLGIDPVRLAEHIEECIDSTPYPHRVEDDIQRVRELARRRRVLRAIEVADAILRCRASDDAMCDRAVERIVEEVNAD